MTSDEKFINPVESAHLSELVDVYTYDLARHICLGIQDVLLVLKKK
jgi:hypothetical protein